MLAGVEKRSPLSDGRNFPAFGLNSFYKLVTGEEHFNREKNHEHKRKAEEAS